MYRWDPDDSDMRFNETDTQGLTVSSTQIVKRSEYRVPFLLYPECDQYFEEDVYLFY